VDTPLSLDARLAAARKAERWLEAYRLHPEVFGAFEAAEDPSGLTATRLAKHVGLAGQTVLEVGGGTGWLTRRVAHFAKSYIVAEPNPHMQAVGHGQRAFASAEVLRARGELLPLQTGSINSVLASFVLLDLVPKLRQRVLEDAARVLAPRAGSAVWVIENHGTGEYQELRGIADREAGLGEVRPLVDELGFELVDVVETSLDFDSEAMATGVLGTILGKAVRAKLEARPRRRLGLNLAILRWTP